MVSERTDPFCLVDIIIDTNVVVFLVRIEGWGQWFLSHIWGSLLARLFKEKLSLLSMAGASGF